MKTAAGTRPWTGPRGEPARSAPAKVDWRVDVAEGKVMDFTVHFDESPFDPNFGGGDYCAGKHCSGHQHGTDKLVAHAKAHAPDYVRCHRYKITVVLSDGSKQPIDPTCYRGYHGRWSVTLV